MPLAYDQTSVFFYLPTLLLAKKTVNQLLCGGNMQTGPTPRFNMQLQPTKDTSMANANGFLPDCSVQCTVCTLMEIIVHMAQSLR